MKSIMIDSNLLLLAIVGRASRSYVGRHKRVKEFSLADYDRLSGILTRATRIIVTPNVLTEVSNLAYHIEEPARTKIAQQLQHFIQAVTVVDERFVKSADAVERGEFQRLGLTDSTLLALGREPATLLTADLHLYLAATSAGYQAENFNHLRPD